MGTELVQANGNGNGAGLVARQEFGATQIERRAETSAVAVAAQAKAAIEARYSMAIARPRNWSTVRIRLLEQCKRPGFAKISRYAKPLGKKQNKETGKWEQQFARGFSIRFAETAAREMGNLLIETITVYDDDKTRIFRVFASELETNLTSYSDVLVAKTVERQKPREGTVILGERINSYGDRVFIVEATDDEMAVKSAALISKARRNLILQLIPGDILDDAKEMVDTTLNDPNAVDPLEEQKRIFDGFAKMRVMPEDLEAYLGHAPNKCTPAEMEELRGLWVALKDGETTWSAVMADKEDAEAPAPPPEGQAAKTPPKTTADLKARERAKAAEKKMTIRGSDGKPIDTSAPPPQDGPPLDSYDRDPGQEG
jgi:hypothetical protein